MYSHQIDEMAEALGKRLSALALVSLTTEEATECARKVLAEYWHDKIAITWVVGDLLPLANEHGYALSREKAVEILLDVFHKNDANSGVNWSTFVDEIKTQGRELSEEENEKFNSDRETITDP